MCFMLIYYTLLLLSYRIKKAMYAWIGMSIYLSPSSCKAFQGENSCHSECCMEGNHGNIHGPKPNT